MTARTLPQKHCRNITDHPAHRFERFIHFTSYWFSCPGRYTPSNYRAPAASPTQPEDPFAGIPSAHEE